MTHHGPLRVGIGGPVGSGKTTLVEKLCKAARDSWSIGVVTNDILRDNHLYVACQTDDDIPYVLTVAGEGNLIMGTDYGHADTASELAALNTLRNMSGVGAERSNRILDGNARALYAL